jgi:diguanylate cyclase (GGDEF)-like protein
MLDIDILTTFVTCGAAACVAALMTMLVRADEPMLDSALRISSAGFAVLGLSLVQLLGGVRGPDALPMVLALLGSSCGITVIGWGLLRLAGHRVPPAWAAAILLLLVLAQLAALQSSAWALGAVYSGAITLLCVLATLGLKNFLLRPRHIAEGILGWAMVGCVLAYGLRLALTLVHDGPAVVHHVYGPPAVLRLLGILYSVMPIFMATVLLSTVNARLTDRLALRAMTDELTGTMNRRALRDLAPTMMAEAYAGGSVLALLMLDIDHFKRINNTHGHLLGDDVLRRLAATLRASLRQDALITRFGGEEFALLVPVRDASQALQTAQRLRLAVAALDFQAEGQDLQVTVSIGLTLLGAGQALDAGLRRADAALYRAKNDGRNRVHSADAAYVAEAAPASAGGQTDPGGQPPH